MPPCGDFILTGGSKEEVHLSHGGGQQKLGLLSEAKREKRHTQTKSALTPGTPIPCGEILQQNIAPFQPPFAQTDHGNLRPVPSPAHEQERRGRHAGTESSGVALGAESFFEGQMRLSGCKERKGNAT